MKRNLISEVCLNGTSKRTWAANQPFLEARPKRLLWLERLADLLHGLLTSSTVFPARILPEDLADVVHHFFHLRVIHGIQGFQNSQFSQRFHIRSGGYVNNGF